MAEPAPLRGRLRPPGDKSTTHRALLLAGLAEGRSLLHGALDAEDTRATRRVIEALGARVVDRDGGALEVHGRPEPRAPDAPLDCANAGTLARLALGLLAGHDGAWTLTGDASLSARPMARVTRPLRALGARIDAPRDVAAADEAAADGALRADRPPDNAAPRADRPPPEEHLPLRVTGTALRGGRVRVELPSAQVKSALLLAGLRADAPLTVLQHPATRDETERLLPRFGARVERAAGEATVFPGALRGAELAVPGDPSSAAYLLLAALLVPGSAVTVEGVELSPRRTGFLRALERADACVLVSARRAPGAGDAALRTGGTALTRSGAQSARGETGDLVAEACALRPFDIAPADVPDLIDELPVLVVAACAAEGTSRFAGLAELRHKESDRFAELAALARELGAEVAVDGDALAITGRGRLSPPRTVEHPDHRVALARAVARYAAAGGPPPSPASAAISYPRFAEDLARLGAG